MEPIKITPVDRLAALKGIKKKVDEAYKEADVEAQIYLDVARENGQTSLISTFFGEDAGEYKRGKTRKKHVVEFNVADIQDFNKWLYSGNIDAMSAYICDNAKEFAEYWFDKTGELPDGISRVEYDEPPTLKKADFYRFDQELVMSKLADNGFMLNGVNQLLLGDTNVG